MRRSLAAPRRWPGRRRARARRGPARRRPRARWRTGGIAAWVARRTERARGLVEAIERSQLKVAYLAGRAVRRAEHTCGKSSSINQGLRLLAEALPRPASRRAGSLIPRALESHHCRHTP